MSKKKNTLKFIQHDIERICLGFDLLLLSLDQIRATLDAYMMGLSYAKIFDEYIVKCDKDNNSEITLNEQIVMVDLYVMKKNVKKVNRIMIQRTGNTYSKFDDLDF